ncbi:MAG: (2Fe-2S)-binding protein [Candidatus Marinimicrobia bacterium]|nr:(2Fe-2S)-binding protein [Candidatus Neomarinimicrobiota bacterium]
MPTLTIDNQQLTAPEGQNLLAAARGLGIDIPTLCWREGLEHVTSCMLCVVEDCRTGILHPACSTPVAAGMQIATASATVIEARRMALELLLGDHLGDCEGPCRRACAAGMDIPLMLRQIAAGDWRAAVRVVKRHIALPATLGRICPAPCEKICRRGAHDAPVGICLLKRYVADADLASADPYLPEMAAPSGYRVAVVGAGPAGLAAAYALMRAGHACTVFEKEALPGGGLRSPELYDRLPPDVLAAEIMQIRRLGLRLETGVTLGADRSIEELKQQFDAVILAWGEVSPDLAGRLGLECGPHGLAVDRHTHRTADPVVFACGNAVSPGRLTVRVVGQGRATALAVDQMLRGAAPSDPRREYDHRLTGALDPAEIAVLLADASPGPRVVPADAAAGYTAAEARAEAARCLHCDCRKATDCRLRQYATAYRVNPYGWKPTARRGLAIVRQGHITYEPGKCIACGICIRITTAAREPLGLTFIGRGFDVRVGVPFNQSLAAGLGRVAAACVAACPTGALSGAPAEQRRPARGGVKKRPVS